MKIKKISALLLAMMLGAGIYGCGSTNEQVEVSSTDEAETQEAAETEAAVTEKRELTEEELKNAEEAGISPERYCTDVTPVNEKALELFKQYYDGIEKCDHEICFSVFPDFYKKAIEEENAQYNQTNEEYMKEIHQNIADMYGEDFYISPSVTQVLQLNDESLSLVQDNINRSFGTEITVDDIYYVYMTESVRGNIDKASTPLEYCMLLTGGQFYLYDTYFEKPVNESEYTEETPADDETEAQLTVAE